MAMGEKAPLAISNCRRHYGLLLDMTPDADVFCEMIGFAAERLRDLEGGAITGAARGEKTPVRFAQRYGL
jgi:hypothetical protein